MPPKHTSLFYIRSAYYLLRNGADEETDVDREVGDEKQACWAVLRVCKSSTSRAYSVYCRINWSISNPLWPWSDSLCFLPLAARAYNNTSIVVTQGQKARSNLAAVVCGPSSCCIVSNRTYHLHHLTEPTSKRTTGHWESHESCLLTKCGGGAQEPGCPWPLLRRQNHLGSTQHALIPQAHENTACVFSPERTVTPLRRVDCLAGRRPRSYEVFVWERLSAGKSI